MSFWNQAADKANPEIWARQRLVPAQPDGVPSGQVFLGSDIGFVDYSGVQPKPGDTVAIIGQQGRRVALMNHALPSLQTPTFAGGCVCRCPGNSGVALYLCYPGQVANLLAIDAQSGALLQVIGQRELGYGVSLVSHFDAAVAVDPASPHSLYVLDDRRGFTTVRTDANPVATRGYFGLATFILTNGAYSFSSFTPMTDPYHPGPHDPLNPAVEPDPPAIPTNCLAVIGGVPLVTMLNSPARYLAILGNTVVTHTLTQNGQNSSLQLRGNIVRVTDAPAQRTNDYVIGFDGANYFLVEFNSTTDVISRTIILPQTPPAVPVALATTCNRIIVLNSSTPTLNS